MTCFSGGIERRGPLHSGIAQLEWLSYQSGGRGNLGNIGWVVPVAAGTPPETVEKVVASVVDRHEALRSAYDADALGHPQQTVHRRVEPTFTRITSTGIQEFVDHQFDVSTEPPIRFARTDDGDLAFAVAHIAADGLAGWIVYKELRDALRSGGEHPGWGPDVSQPLDHALNEVGERQSRSGAALRHWESILRQLPATVLPVTQGQRGAEIVGAELDTLAGIQALAVLRDRLGASPSSIFTAAVCLALAVQYSRRRFGVSLTWAYRELPSTRDIVAAVFRDMPLMVDLDGRPSFDEVVARLQRAVLLSGRRMGFDVLEFSETAGRIAAERGHHLPGPEVVSCTFDGIDWDAVPLDRDLEAIVASSRLRPIRTNLPQDVCNVYVRSHAVDERISIQSRTDSATARMADPGDLVRLIESILVQAAAHGPLSFDAAARLARAPWRPDGRWGRLGDVWVDLDSLAMRLEEHPGVRNAQVEESEDGITAFVRADLEPWELRDFMLCTDNGRSAVVSPRHFIIERSNGTTITGQGVERPPVLPATAAEQALHDALSRTQGLGSATCAGTYLGVGGRLMLVPRVLADLRAQDYEGITVEDFRRPISLRALAAQLTRVDAVLLSESATG